MKKKLKISMHDTTLLWKTSKKFDLDFDKLSFILLDYIKNNNTELYYLRMSELCGSYDPFIRQSIKHLILECQDIYNAIGEIDDIKLTGNKLIIRYEDLNDETTRETDLSIPKFWYNA